jgi:hypothetical protein
VKTRAVVGFVLGLVERQSRVSVVGSRRGSTLALQRHTGVVGSDRSLTRKERDARERVVETFLIDERGIEGDDQLGEAIGELVHGCLSTEAVESLGAQGDATPAERI